MIISYVIMACSVTGLFSTSIKTKKKKKKKLASWLTPQCEPPAVGDSVIILIVNSFLHTDRVMMML